MIALTLIFLKVSKEIMVKKSLTPKLELVHPPNSIFPLDMSFSLRDFCLRGSVYPPNSCLCDSDPAVHTTY